MWLDSQVELSLCESMLSLTIPILLLPAVYLCSISGPIAHMIFLLLQHREELESIFGRKITCSNI